MIEIQNLTIKYDKDSETILHKVSLNIGKENLVIVGSNGSGKTTFFKAILGLTPISEGSIKLFDIESKKVHNRIELSTNIIDVYKLIFLPIKDIIKIFAKLKGGDSQEAFNYINEFDLQNILGKKLHNLSIGQQKMFGNIMALSFAPQIALLDEPFENVDQNRRKKLLDLILNSNSKMIIITHEFSILSKLVNYKMYFLLDKKLWGEFNASDLDKLYITKGLIENSIKIIETTFGTYSISLDEGSVALRTAPNINSLLNLV